MDTHSASVEVRVLRTRTGATLHGCTRPLVYLFHVEPDADGECASDVLGPDGNWPSSSLGAAKRTPTSSPRHRGNWGGSDCNQVRRESRD
jgi:hypothetical protein